MNLSSKNNKNILNKLNYNFRYYFGYWNEKYYSNGLCYGV